MKGGGERMKKLIGILVVVLLVSGSAFAADWTIALKAGNATAGNAGSTNFYGAKDAATTDGFDSGTDFGYGTIAGTTGNVAYYHATPYGGDANSIYKWDYHAKLDITKGTEWNPLYVWASAGYTPTILTLRYYTQLGTTPGITDTQKIYLEIISDPTGTYQPGFQVEIPRGVSIASASAVIAFTWTGEAVNMLKNGGLSNPAKCKLVVAPNIPEPSSLLALASGLAGLAGFAWRRRS